MYMKLSSLQYSLVSEEIHSPHSFLNTAGDEVLVSQFHHQEECSCEQHFNDELGKYQNKLGEKLELKEFLL